MAAHSAHCLPVPTGEWAAPTDPVGDLGIGTVVAVGTVDIGVGLASDTPVGGRTVARRSPAWWPEPRITLAVEGSLNLLEIQSGQRKFQPVSRCVLSVLERKF